MSLHPGPERLRSLLLRSVTYVRASFPWELRDLRAANDAAPPATTASLFAFPFTSLPGLRSGKHCERTP